jgi:hypothetical protein
MVNATELKKVINQEADRKVQEANSANSLPANSGQPVEQHLAKSSADETKPTAGNAAKAPESSGAKPACPEAQKEFVSPSKDLGKKPSKKAAEKAREKEYVSPSQPLAETPAGK